MKRVELYRWYVFDGIFRKRRLTTYHMSRDEAARRFPGAEREPRTRRYQFTFETHVRRDAALRPPTATLPDPKMLADRAVRAAVDRSRIGRSKEREDRSGKG